MNPRYIFAAGAVVALLPVVAASAFLTALAIEAADRRRTQAQLFGGAK